MYSMTCMCVYEVRGCSNNPRSKVRNTPYKILDFRRHRLYYELEVEQEIQSFRNFVLMDMTSEGPFERTCCGTGLDLLKAK